MKTGFVRPACLLLITFCFSLMVFAQATTSGRLAGIVTDSVGALVPNAEVTATNGGTNESFSTTANDEGGWSIPSVPNGTYTIKISAPNFKTTVLKDVKVDTGQATSANAALEPGEPTAEVVIQGAGEILQTESANVATTIVGRQIVELPFVTRDALQLVLTLPGVQTPGVPRTSSINGLPKGSVNMTLDGVNIQDNFLRSSDGFFTSIQMKSDAVQEVTVSTAVPGAESAGDGAAQIRAVTKSGTSEFHGGAFWQYRSPRFNSNYYFNNVDGLPRDSLFLRQFGGNVGGPILIPKLLKSRNKAFFFLNYEEFRLPQAYGSLSAVGNILVLTQEARQGIFQYRNAAGTLITRNLLTLAGSSDCNPSVAGVQPCPSTIDPTVAAALATINAATLRAGALRSRALSASPQAQDLNRLDYQFQDPGNNIRRFPTARFDWNITRNQHFEFVHNYQHYFADPDAVNGQNSVVPGEGIVIGTPGLTGSIYRNNFTYAAAHRWTISNRLISELRASFGGNGTSTFTREFGAPLFDFWGGYAVTGGTYLGAQTLGTGAFYNRRSTSRRNTPTKGLTENLTFVKGTHTLNFGGSFLRINSWTSAASTQIVPQVVFGITSDDPMNTNVFTNTGAAANFPGASATQLANAQSLYAYLVGRVSAINRSTSLDSNGKYVFDNFEEYNHQNQWAVYVQDSWKFRRNITLNYGLRWQFEPSPVNDNLVYTRTGYDGIFGVSGTDNLFRPGTFGGQPTRFRLLGQGEKGFDTRMKDFAPSFGFAYSPDFKTGFLRTLLGEHGRTVIRGGYSIAFTREGFNAYTAMFGANEGGTVTLNVSPSLTPGIFPAGSVLFRNPGTFPALPVPADAATKYPFTPLAGSAGGSNDFNSRLKAGYTQSFTFGVQRELGKNTAIEARFVRTRGTHLWRQYDLNEVNIFENGFLTQFNAARNNLAISRANNAGDNYGNQGLPGQVNVDLITVGLNSSTNSTMVTRLLQGQAGAAANTIAFNLSNMNRLIINGRLANGTTCTISNPACIPFIPSTTIGTPTSIGCNDSISTTQTCRVSNFFIVNPQTTGGAFLMTQGTDTSFNALQIEVRRRMSDGLLVQGSYQFGTALSNAFVSSSSVFSQPRTLRDPGLDKDYSPWDIRHSFKLDYIYELPFGNGRRWLNSSNGFVNRVVGGWQIGGVTRIQSGPATLLTSGGRGTVNQFDAGVILHNMTLAQFQSFVNIRKTPNGTVFWLPQDIIDNTIAAFASPTGTPLDPSKPYIGPPLTAGQVGERIVFHGPATARFDINVVKRIPVTERVNLEGRVTFLNAFNRPNFFIGDSDATIRSTSAAGSTFGQTRSAYRDITVSGTNDPGGRLIEWQLRLNF